MQSSGKSGTPPHPAAAEHHQGRGGATGFVDYGTFIRTVDLPAEARDEDISAAYDKGLLTVTVPMDTGRTAARRIKINR
ncbi:Hsp20/alpha crystallin family protein [Streptacidiphilus rugosus]|uniref:Hsp20/alpha crystallin family protein n=1 Tax=Streptacidiphilus rugosus TaxID=405783 RepID=UPI000563F925|nr:Hsp20/alpha crystallin family protein [Streptacidiphilus rugosus]